ncbi:hypothetical protein GW756_01430 [bacterium]|nr:hypothetical protein [bacterium]
MSETQADFLEAFQTRAQRLQNQLGLESLDEARNHLTDLVEQVTSLILTALENGKGKKSGTVPGAYKEALQKIKDFHGSTDRLKEGKIDLQARTQQIDLENQEDLSLEIDEAKSLRPLNERVENLEATLFTLQQEIGGVLLPRLNALIQNKFGGAREDLQMAHLQLTRSRALVGKKASKVPTVDQFKRSVLSDVLSVLSKDEASSLNELRIYASVLTEIEGAVSDLEKGLKTVPNMATTATQQMRAKGFHDNRDSIEKQWHKMNQALWRIDCCLAWVNETGVDAKSGIKPWLRMLSGQLERLTGTKFSNLTPLKIEEVDNQILGVETDQILPKVDERGVEYSALPQASKVASNKGKTSPDIVVKKKVGQAPGPARPPKKPRPEVFGTEAREAQESLDEKRRREADERRAQPDFNEFMQFANSLETINGVAWERRDLETEIQNIFEKVVDNYMTLFPEPVKRFWVNRQKLQRAAHECEADETKSLPPELLGYFMQHKAEDFEAAFADFIRKKRPEALPSRGIDQLEGKALSVPSIDRLVAYMCREVQTKLPKEVQMAWAELLRNLAEFKQHKQEYEALCEQAQALQQRIKPGIDIGVRRINSVLESVEKTCLESEISSAKAKVLTSLALVEKSNPTQVLSHLEAAFYDFFGDHCATTDLKS